MLYGAECLPIPISFVTASDACLAVLSSLMAVALFKALFVVEFVTIRKRIEEDLSLSCSDLLFGLSFTRYRKQKDEVEKYVYKFDRQGTFSPRST